MLIIIGCVCQKGKITSIEKKMDVDPLYVTDCAT